jgi:hypothetical protein
LGLKDLNETRFDREQFRYVFDLVETNTSDEELDDLYSSLLQSNNQSTSIRVGDFITELNKQDSFA